MCWQECNPWNFVHMTTICPRPSFPSLPSPNSARIKFLKLCWWCSTKKSTLYQKRWQVLKHPFFFFFHQAHKRSNSGAQCLLWERHHGFPLQGGALCSQLTWMKSPVHNTHQSTESIMAGLKHIYFKEVSNTCKIWQQRKLSNGKTTISSKAS